MGKRITEVNCVCTVQAFVVVGAPYHVRFPFPKYIVYICIYYIPTAKTWKRISPDFDVIAGGPTEGAAEFAAFSQRQISFAHSPSPSLSHSCLMHNPLNVCRSIIFLIYIHTSN
jgi:hypothetical protein